MTRKSSTSERLSALEELLKLSVNGTTSYFDGPAAAELAQRWQTIYARKRAQEFDQLEHSLRHNRH